MLIAATVLLVSCDLDKQPLAQLSPDSFFSNETELQAFSNQFYTIFPSTSVYEEESDMLIKDGLTDEMESARPVPSSGGGWSFTDLRNYNTLIEFSVNSHLCSSDAGCHQGVPLQCHNSRIENLVFFHAVAYLIGGRSSGIDDLHNLACHVIVIVIAQSH